MAQQSNENLSLQVDSIMKQITEENNVPGAILSIVKADSTLLVSGYGVQEIKSKKAVDPTESLFRIGSVTKNITALALMQLVEKGKIDLYGDANDYLVSYQLKNEYEKKITPYDLITHTAGLDNHLLGVQSRDFLDPEDLAPHVIKQFPDQIRQPGEVQLYSSYGTALIAVMIQDVTGMLFNDYVQENIFDPLGMQSTYFFVQDVDKDNLASSYLLINDEHIHLKTINGIYIYPTGSVMTTAEDMAQYMKVFTSDGLVNGIQIIKPQTLALMSGRIFGPFSDLHIGYSIGFFNNNNFNERMYNHTGGIHGFASAMNIYPDSKLAIFLSGNARSTNSNFYGDAKKELEALLLDHNKNLKPELEFSTDVDEKLLNQYAGKYRSVNYSTKTVEKVAMLMGYNSEIDVEVAGDNIISKSNDTLKMLSDGRFWSEKNQQFFAFKQGIEGDKYLINSNGFFEKISFYDSSSFQLNWVLFVVLIQLVSLLIYAAYGTIKKLRIKNSFKWQAWLNILVALSIILFSFLLAVATNTVNPWESAYGILDYVKNILLIPFFIIGLIILNIVILLFKRTKTQSVVFRIFGIVVLISQVSFIFWMYYWNLIGFNYY